VRKVTYEHRHGSAERRNRRMLTCCATPEAIRRRPNRLDRAGQGSRGRDPRAASRQRAGIAHSVYLADLLRL